MHLGAGTQSCRLQAEGGAGSRQGRWLLLAVVGAPGAGAASQRPARGLPGCPCRSWGGHRTPDRGSRAGPLPVAATPPRRLGPQQQREGASAPGGFLLHPRPTACRTKSLHPRCTLGPSIQASHKGKGKRNTLDPHPSTYQCTIQDFIF